MRSPPTTDRAPPRRPPRPGTRPSLSLEALADGIRGGNRAVLAQAITLVENAYPRLKVTAMAKQIRRDTRNGTLPLSVRI